MSHQASQMKNGADKEFVERARRAMIRASDKAMEDYKRFGIEPVLATSSSVKSKQASK
jgi:hypothetical protein